MNNWWEGMGKDER